MKDIENGINETKCVITEQDENNYIFEITADSNGKWADQKIQFLFTIPYFDQGSRIIKHRVKCISKVIGNQFILDDGEINYDLLKNHYFYNRSLKAIIERMFLLFNHDIELIPDRSNYIITN